MSGSVFIWNCRLPFMSSSFREQFSKYATYASGFLFGIGWWLFIDGIVVAKYTENLQVSLGFEDWIPGLIATFGMIIINSIDLSSISEDNGFEYGGSRLASRVKLLLFIGMALIAGGVAGSFAILVIKYLSSGEAAKNAIYTGITGVAQTILILTR
ncbi:Vacuolar protein sorting-associated protein 68 [Smittium culicis]|uniref:Vacuolar protein sorting-associated protein 68 n=1 Tax=Smittium culicis TaxID=133412 RepID=A0A1R1YQU0_9FUNG|nr:Vacuolar protein sorting-associated protein 68 [Smittium culicis]